MLPIEIWQVIIDNVENLRTLFRIRRVCQAWKVYVSKVTVIDKINIFDMKGHLIPSMSPNLRCVRQPFFSSIADVANSLVNATINMMENEWFNVLAFLQKPGKMKQIEYISFERPLCQLEITPTKLTFNWSAVPSACAIEIITLYVNSGLPKINIEVDNYIWSPEWNHKVDSLHVNKPDNQTPRTGDHAPKVGCYSYNYP